MERSRERSSSIELLRIIMIILIIAHHFIVNSGIVSLYDLNNVSKNMVFCQIFGMWGKTGINVFTLITGYFMVKRKLTFKKLLQLYIEVKFYRVFFYLIFVIAGYETVSRESLTQIMFSLTYETGKYYLGSMMIMYALIPFINLLVNCMTKRQYQCLLVITLTYFTVLPTFFMHETFDFVSWLIVCYLIGGYIRLFPGKWDSFWGGSIMASISVILSIASVIVVDFVGHRFGFDYYYHMVSDCNKFLAIVVSISIFILFKNIRMPNIRCINVMSSATLGVLCIHANSDAMRKLLWQDIFNNAGHYENVWLIPYACGAVLIVYVLCVMLDLIRVHLLEKPVFKWISKYEWINKEVW